MLLEPNNLISDAAQSGVDSATEEKVTLSESIDTVSDIDLYQFQLDRGQGITLDIDTAATEENTPNFDLSLRVFDVEGNELAFNDDSVTETEEFTIDPYVGFVANSTGQYYVGVSSTVNQTYDPLSNKDLEQFSGNFVAGDYDLTFDLVEVSADEDPDSAIAEATDTEVNIDKPNGVFPGEIATESDVDFYKLEVSDEAGIKVNLNAVGDNSGFDSYLRLFDADGKELAFNDNSLDPDNITNNSAISFAPQAAGEYFIGVSSAGNFDYDQLNGNTNLNFSSNTGISTGEYELELEVLEIVADSDPDNTIAEAIDSAATAENDDLIFEGEIDAEIDIDLYQVEIGEGEGVNLNINTQGLDSELDSYIRLFDEQGNELTFDDNNDANFTEFSPDSSLAFVPDLPGTYYAGVGTSGNFEYDPLNGRTNFSVDVISPFATTGKYELGIDLVEVEQDSDSDNTIAEAVESNTSSTGMRSVVVEGEIDPAADVDLYRFELEQGDGVTVNLNAANNAANNANNSNLDSYLRLFDEDGNELLFDNDDENGLGESGTDSFLSFATDNSGEYFIGVSSDGNTTYDAVNGRTNFTPTTGFSTGSYDLAIDISEVVADFDPDNTIASAIDTEFEADDREGIILSGEIATDADADLYLVELEQGDTVGFDIDTEMESDTRLDTVIQVFDANGDRLSFNDDDSAPDENSNLDSYLEFTAFTTGKYYVGVSSYGNFNYDPLKGSNNFSNDFGSTVGNYDLAIALTDSIDPLEGTEAADSLAGTGQPDLIKGLAGNDTISGAGQGDIIIGGLGNDSLQGDAGDDFIQGDKGADELYGGSGNDTLDGDLGRDLLFGNGGTDTFIISSKGGVDTISDFEDESDKIVLPDDISFADLTIEDNLTLDGITVSFEDKILVELAAIAPEQLTVDDFIS